jgi:transcriptional regulator with XRE-family HTH domain
VCDSSNNNERGTTEVTHTTYAAQSRTLTAAMEAAGLDGAQIAQAAGVSKQFVSLLVRGHRRCNPDIAAAIARELGHPLSTLFTSANLSDYPYNSEEESVVLDRVQQDEDPILYFEDVAEVFRIKPKTLRHMRATGEGPPFSQRGRRGRLRIRKSQADAWYRQTYEAANE